MTLWNYRVLRKQHIDGSVTYHIHEVYYGKDGEIEGWKEKPVTPMGNDVAELREVMRMICHDAFRYSVLEERQTGTGISLFSDPMDDTVSAGHYWEFLDRAFVAGEYLNQFLGSHPVLMKEGTLRAAYERAEEAFAELYLCAGRLAFDKDH